ncbi:NUDIX hydrolase [Angustibacter sp. McL0619]|uniref:NUDIX hydrolase n=1 Tax=Angustibacter sp. McL0619 TaxID=3415676 RepID=UPI003CF91A64
MSGLLDDVRRVLGEWEPPTSAQAELREGYLAHLRVHEDGIWRDGPPAHLTASCFVLDPSGERALLTLHRKGGFWVQFGGHLEPSDTSLAAAALREGVEESGVPGLRLLGSAGLAPVDLDRHALSSRFGRCREHLDVAFVAIAAADSVPVVSDESDHVAWWPVDQLPSTAVDDLPGRLARVAARVRQLAASSVVTSVASAAAAPSSAPSSSPIAEPAAAATPSR